MSEFMFFFPVFSVFECMHKYAITIEETVLNQNIHFHKIQSLNYIHYHSEVWFGVFITFYLRNNFIL